QREQDQPVPCRGEPAGARRRIGHRPRLLPQPRGHRAAAAAPGPPAVARRTVTGPGRGAEPLRVPPAAAALLLRPARLREAAAGAQPDPEHDSVRSWTPAPLDGGTGVQDPAN